MIIATTRNENKTIEIEKLRYCIMAFVAERKCKRVLKEPDNG
jgi:hypothetical protein